MLNSDELRAKLLRKQYPKSYSKNDPGREVTSNLHPSPLKRFDLLDLAFDPELEDLKVKDLVAIGSYNIVSGEDPVIIVPGSPKIWTDPIPPFKLDFDDQTVYRDLNALRFPTYPLLASVLSSSICTPAFDWPSTDFFTDRNALRKLLRWVRGVKGKDFRIDVQLAGEKTVILERWETRLVEGPTGFGFNFEKFSTKPAVGCEQCVGHYRVVAYEFGGFKIVQRFEVDACLQSPPTTTTRDTSLYAVRSHEESRIDEISALAEGLSSLNIIPSSGASEPTGLLSGRSHHGITVLKSGSLVPQNSIIELTTVGEKYLKKHTFDWTEAYPQLYLSQTPNLYLAAHQKGLFTAIQKRKLSDADMIAREKRLQDTFKKLMTALRQIKEAVSELGREKKLSLVYEDGQLALFEREDKRGALPGDWLKIFDTPKSA